MTRARFKQCLRETPYGASMTNAPSYGLWLTTYLNTGSHVDKTRAETERVRGATFYSPHCLV
jgi:hypothetical protein